MNISAITKNNVGFTVNTTTPTITSITTTKPTGIYSNEIDDTIDITVNFSENMWLVGGNLVLTLNSGGSVNITPFTNSNTAMGTYTVAQDCTTNTNGNLLVSSSALSAGTLRMLLKIMLT